MIDPMLLHHAEEDFVLTDDWVLELKYDGVRAILDTTGQVKVLYTRRGHEIHDQFPEIDAPPGLVLDGEIVGFDGEFHKLNWVQRRLGVKGADKILERSKKFPITFVAFDILGIVDPQHDFRSLEFSKRRSMLEALSDEITVSPVYPASNIDTMWDYVRKNNLEGLVAKRKDSKYVQGIRTYNWRKIKHSKPEYRSDS